MDDWIDYFIDLFSFPSATFYFHYYYPSFFLEGQFECSHSFWRCFKVEFGYSSRHIYWKKSRILRNWIRSWSIKLKNNSVPRQMRKIKGMTVSDMKYFFHDKETMSISSAMRPWKFSREKNKFRCDLKIKNLFWNSLLWKFYINENWEEKPERITFTIKSKWQWEIYLVLWETFWYFLYHGTTHLFIFITISSIYFSLDNVFHWFFSLSLNNLISLKFNIVTKCQAIGHYCKLI